MPYDGLQATPVLLIINQLNGLGSNSVKGTLNISVIMDRLHDNHSTAYIKGRGYELLSNSSSASSLA